nr:immunoglobulin light chain junction region [Macaca mulatta]
EYYCWLHYSGAYIF